jgi:hypothetical protein
MVDVKLYEGDKPVPVSAETVFNFVKAVIAAGKEAELLKAAQEVNSPLEARRDLVNLVKSFLHENKLDEKDAAMAHIVAPRAGAPSCF